MAEHILVTGAGGFIGHHLIKYLTSRGYSVRGVDIKYPEYEETSADEFYLLDLRRRDNCLIATQGIDQVYNLAADMGGIGYITAYLADIARNNILINTHMLEASHLNNVQKFFYSSSACIYPSYMQTSADIAPLKESDAYPADPEEGYGWEKLFAEKMCQYYTHDYGMETRVARFHNVYGPLGTYDGGREKAPAAICRKLVIATNGGEIEVWGDGEQTRSFMYIDDCTEGIYRIMQSSISEPLNLGMDIMVTINELVDMIASISGKKIIKRHDLTKPQGVRGRNSDNSKLATLLEWEPSVSLESGLSTTYHWIKGEIESNHI
ncbi:MAG: NAD-dependent epimerase/dehydratase family protein [Chloroflexota bacterium]|nr:NAD-dependent epimerase/dehydratase family protein [Chloroflexota bacterium]